MPNFRDEVCIRAFLNALIIDRAVETAEFKQCVSDVLTLNNASKEEAEEYQFKGPAYSVGLLYCLIVLPKEKLIFSPENPVYKQLKEKKVVDLFNITLRESGSDVAPAYSLIRRLRNSIAHGDFEIDESHSFVFRDCKSGGALPCWEAQVTYGNLLLFLNELARVLYEIHRPGK